MVFARSSLSVHSDYLPGSANTGPVPPEQSPHTEPGTVVPETHFLLSQMEQTSHTQLQVSEKGTQHIEVTLYVIIHSLKGEVHIYSAPIKIKFKEG